jgi:hypothetical protein
MKHNSIFLSSRISNLLPELPQSSLPGDLALPLNLYPVSHFRLNVSNLFSRIRSISSVTAFFALFGSLISYFVFCKQIPHNKSSPIYKTHLGNQKVQAGRPKLYGKHRIFFFSLLQPPDRLWAPKYQGALSSKVKRLGFEAQQQPLFISAVNFTSLNAVVQRHTSKQRASRSHSFLCISKTLSYNSQDGLCVLEQCSKTVCQKTLTE